MNGTTQMAGANFRFAHPRLDFSPQVLLVCNTFRTRPPLKLPPFSNVIRAFPSLVWIATVVTIAFFTSVFCLFYKVRNDKFHY